MFGNGARIYMIRNDMGTTEFSVGAVGLRLKTASNPEVLQKGVMTLAKNFYFVYTDKINLLLREWYNEP